MTLDEATAALVEQALSQRLKPASETQVAEARAEMAAFTEMFGPGPAMREVRDESVPTAAGPLPVRVLIPEGPVRGVIVFAHGGGWVVGSAGQWDTQTRTVADRTRCVAIVPDYRLAPEHPYPAALDDCWETLRWADEGPAELGIKGLPLIVAGDSAGGNLAAAVAQRARDAGNLAAAVAQRARDAGGPTLALQVLIYPPTDADFETDSYRADENQLITDRDFMIWYWDHYVPDPTRRLNSGAAPLRAEDLSGLAPAVIVIAEHDVLRDEIEAYAERLRESAVPVRSRVFEGQMHGFVTLMNILPGNADGIDYVCAEIDRALGAAAGQEEK